jgi:hypothetical protein
MESEKNRSGDEPSAGDIECSGAERHISPAVTFSSPTTKWTAGIMHDSTGPVANHYEKHSSRAGLTPNPSLG